MATSFASLSSDEDAGGWDLATAPHVNRTSLKHSTKTNSYNAFADDESSESSLQSVFDNCLIQGNFTSTDRMSIRWASPLKTQLFPEQVDGRRRARVGSVVGHMTCTIIGHSERGVKMRLDYQGTCSDIWFPGVATMLGLDFVLDTYDCDVSWEPDCDGKVGWTLDAETPALSGFNIGSNHRSLSRRTSLELPTIPLQRSQHSRQATGEEGHLGPSRTASSASLLRIPIPSHSTTDYSFEDSPLMTPASSNLPSSFTSLTPSMSQSSLALALASQDIDEANVPSTPITLHLNMNKLKSSSNSLTFNISGTVAVSRRSSSSSSILGSIDLPVFRSLKSDEDEETDLVVRNQTENALVEIHNSHSGGSTISQDMLTGSKDRKVTLSVGMQSKCGQQGTEILVKAPLPRTIKSEDCTPTLSQSPRTTPVPSVPTGLEVSHQFPDQKLDDQNGPLIIPWIIMTVTPSISHQVSEWSYAVTMSLPAPLVAPSKWLEFGFTAPQGQAQDNVGNYPQISITCASIDGIPVHVENYAQMGDRRRATGDSWLKGDMNNESTINWFHWSRIPVASHGHLEVVYVVTGNGLHESRSLRGSHSDVHLFLPRLSLPVARLQLDLDSVSGKSASSDSDQDQ